MGDGEPAGTQPLSPAQAPMDDTCSRPRGGSRPRAFVLCITLFLALTLYACQSKRNFGFMGAGLFAGLWVIAGASSKCSWLALGGTGRTVWALCGSLLFCGFIYDTWKVCKVYGYDDYIVAAIELYLDIINLFLYLSLLSKR